MVDLHNIKNIYEYLDAARKLENIIILCTIKDNAGFHLDNKVQEQLYAFGLKQQLINKGMIGYVAAISPFGAVFESIPVTDGEAKWSGVINETQISLGSAPYSSMNYSSIRINGKEYSVNSRGLNFVIYDIVKRKVIDRVAFDTHTKNIPCIHLDEMYDVGIFGWWYNQNYGATLTYYALNKAIESLGYSVLMLFRSTDNPSIPDIVSTRFAYNHYHISPRFSKKELCHYNEMCKSFLLGSDQLWNPDLERFTGDEFFLSFADNEKLKIAYAQSFGNYKSLPTAFKDRYIGLVRKFNGISVREDYASELCKNVFGINAPQVCDPVFLVEKSVFEDLNKEADIKLPQKYLLCFLLDPNPEKIEICNFMGEKLGLSEIIYFTDLDHAMEKAKVFNASNVFPNASIENFISSYMNADYVITDSFHGTCMATIFQKNYISLANTNRGSGRFGSLMRWLKLEDRLFYDYDKEKMSNLKNIDYEEVNTIIEKSRKSSLKWLENNLKTPKDKLPDIILPDSVAQAVKPEICTGCGACAHICPTAAITMLPDSEGFLKPVINNEKCTRCGLCAKKCVAINPVHKNSPSPECWAMTASDEVRKISSSGGMFTVAAEHIINLGGYVCGAAYRGDFSVEHIIVHDINELSRLRGSKYIQSRADDAYPEVKKLLEGGASVLFTGMPCQVAGLYSYLGKEYENLYTIDLLCHGITSFKVFEKYKKDVLGERELTRLEFKAKEPWGWHAGVNAYFSDGTKYSQPLEKDPYYIAYLNSISKNAACGVCSVNRLPRQGDMTIGDFWGIAKYDPSMNDNKGTSVVLLNNEKGKKLFGELQDKMASSKQEPLSVAIGGNHIIEHPYPLNKNRRAFFENFDKLPFEALTLGCFRNRLYEQQYLELVKIVPKEDHEFYYIARLAAENSKGRKIVTWIRSGKFESVLKRYFGLEVAFGVTMREEKVNGDYIRIISELKGKKDQYYIVSLDRAYDEESYRLLTSFGYKEKDDFIYRRFKPIVIEKYDLSKGNYYDSYGNTIEGINAVVGRVVFRGYNNHLVLGKHIPTAGNLNIDFSINGYVEIGENTRFNSICKMESLGFNGSMSVDIGANCRFHDFLFRLYPDKNEPSILIGDLCTFETDLELHANSGKKIIIGRDCMFSHDVDLWAGDGHSIFDVKTGENINSVYEKQPAHRNQIVIGEHVWVAKGAFIMHGTNVGNGSIVGAKSVVKGIFPNNCSIAGNPAAKVRSDVAWSRDMITDNINRCGSAEWGGVTHS